MIKDLCKTCREKYNKWFREYYKKNHDRLVKYHRDYRKGRKELNKSTI